jgi:hypothetical protein
LTHEERLRLIMAPFPVVRRLDPSYPHAGTIIGDTFFGDGEPPSRYQRGLEDEDGNTLAVLYTTNERRANLKT